MKFMLMMHAPRGNGDWQIEGWTAGDFKAHIEFMHSYNKALTEAGEFVAAEGLTPPGQAHLVRAGANGAPPVTDGPFPESKEYLAGYWIIQVDRPERALELAAKASAAPGPGGRPLNMPIEVRQVMSGPLPTE
ncbi:MAG TPA: YciI family protein [Gemmatimonadales bacterium]|nr:YciI family protein [Gemmatimonadales bacterium]